MLNANKGSRLNETSSCYLILLEVADIATYKNINSRIAIITNDLYAISYRALNHENRTLMSLTLPTIFQAAVDSRLLLIPTNIKNAEQFCKIDINAFRMVRPLELPLKQKVPDFTYMQTWYMTKSISSYCHKTMTIEISLLAIAIEHYCKTSSPYLKC